MPAELRATLALAAPLAAANVATMVMGITNAVMVGHLGGAVYFTLVMICQGVLNAVAPLAAHAIGAGDHDAAGRIAAAGLGLAALLAMPMLVLLTVAPLLLHAIGYEPKLAADIAGYLSAIRWGAPAFLLSAVLRAMLSASGRPRVVMVVLLCGIPANAALNWVLIFGHLGLPALGIAGSGCATAAIQWLMMLTIAGYMALAPGTAPVRFGRGLSGRRLFAEFGQILRVGLPIGGLFAMEIGVFNTTGVLMGLFGADAPAAAVRAGRTAIALAAGFMLAMSVLLLAAPLAIIRLYLDIADPANRGVVQIAVSLIAIAALFQVLDGVQVVAVGALRGYRDTTVPMLVAAIGYWGIGFSGGWALAFPLGWGPVGMWWGLALGLAVVAVSLTLRLEWRARSETGPGTAAAPQPAPL